MFCDLAFMGGGVRGIGFVGAVKGLEDSGYRVRRTAGTSAGAIVAALVAAGYSGEEMREEMSRLNYLKFRSKDHANLGLIGEFVNLRRDYGVYSADYFEEWMHELLVRKGKTTFGDLEGGVDSKKLQLTAADLLSKRLLVLPEDLRLFGIDPSSYSIAKAVRMSMSIPLFYEAFRLKDIDGIEHLIVDGGLFCNYPIWLLDDGCGKLDVPTLGLKFVDCKTNVSKRPRKIFRLTDYVVQVIDAVMDAQGHGYARVTRGDSERTINVSVCVDGRSVGVTDFGLSDRTADALFDNGYTAAKEFLSGWDFGKWQGLRG